MPSERLLRLPSREGGWLKADIMVASNSCLAAATHLKPSHHLASTEALPTSPAPHLEGTHLGLHARLAPTPPSDSCRDLRTGCHAQAARSWGHCAAELVGVNEAQGRWTS